MIEELPPALDPLIDPLARLVLILVVLTLTWIVQRLVRLLLIRLAEAFFQAVTRIATIDVSLKESLSTALTRPVQLLVVTIGVRLALMFVELPATAINIVNQIAGSLIIVAVFWLLYRLVDVISHAYVTRASQDTSSLDETIVRFIRQIGIFLIFVFGVTLILQQWGQDVGGLIAGLGVASLAVALGAQDALSHLIAYFAIVTDAPFKVGDFIIIDGVVKGRIQEISFRSTRIRTIDNSLMVIPNNTIANANIVNWARSRKRRLDMLVGLTYSTTAGQFHSIIEAVKAMLQAHDRVTADRILVEFVEFGESSLDMRITFMVTCTNWEDLEMIKTDINFKLMNIIAENGASVAFPTRTIHVETDRSDDIEERV